MDNIHHFRYVTVQMYELYEKKNEDYGDSFHDTFVEEGYACSRIRISDKLNRFKQLTKTHQQNVTDESIRDTLMDLACYAVMTIMEIDNNADKGDRIDSELLRNRIVKELNRSENRCDMLLNAKNSSSIIGRESENKKEEQV